MISVVIGSGITTQPQPPVLDDGSAEALQAHADYEFVCTMRNLRSAGYAFSQAESNDFQAAETAFDSLSDYTKTWLVSAISASATGDVVPAFDESYIPELMTFIALLVTQQWGAIFVLFVKVGLKFLLNRLRDQLDPDSVVADLVGTLDNAFWDRSDPDNPVYRPGTSAGAGLDSLHIEINTNPEPLPYQDWNIK